MTRAVFLFILLAIICSSCSSVSRHDDSADLPTLPKQEFSKITAFFEKNDGDIPISKGARVLWSETQLYRVYTTEDYTIVQYPKDFDRDAFQIVVLNGVLANATEFYQGLSGSENLDFGLLKAPSNEADNLSRPTFLGIRIGDTYENVISTLTKVASKANVPEKDLQLIDQELGGNYTMITARLGTKEIIYTHCFFSEGVLMKLDISRPSAGRIGTYKLLHKSVDEIGNGSFIPK